MFDKKFKISIKTLQYFEEMLAEELRLLGAEKIELSNRMVHCYGDLQMLYKCNLHLRTALRVLVPIVEFPIREADGIYTQAMKTDWTQFMSVEQTFAIDPNVHSEFIKHSNYASVKLKDAIADCFKKKFGHRPNVDPDKPDVLFNLHIDNHRVTISMDSSGESLNRRGYRRSGAIAPLNEVLAAAMIMLTSYKGKTDFYDPMCGSGTLAIEAAMIAGNIPPQFMRNEFGFKWWTNFDTALWRDVKHDAQQTIRPIEHKIYASDKDKWQLAVANENIENAGFEEDIITQHVDFLHLKPQSENGVLVMNPPYGERMGDEDVIPLYKNIGTHLKHNWPGHRAWVMSSNIDALKQIGLKPSKKFELANGPLLCKYHCYELFSGKRTEHLYG